MADELLRELAGAALIGYNLKKFDLPMLVAEFARCGIDFSLKDRLVIDAFQIFREMQPRDLSGALERNVRFGDPVCTLAEKAVYYKARIRDGRNIFRQERNRDHLRLSSAGHSKEDYLCDIGNRLWSDILECESNESAARPLTHCFPAFLGYFRGWPDEFTDLPG